MGLSEQLSICLAFYSTAWKKWEKLINADCLPCVLTTGKKALFLSVYFLKDARLAPYDVIFIVARLIPQIKLSWRVTDAQGESHSEWDEY